ncbi:YqzL family protein [Oceanobacillus saliphilus]
MIDLTWKVFSQTGNIETYLLMKELENATFNQEYGKVDTEELSSLDAKL